MDSETRRLALKNALLTTEMTRAYLNKDREKFHELLNNTEPYTLAAAFATLIDWIGKGENTEEILQQWELHVLNYYDENPIP